MYVTHNVSPSSSELRPYRLLVLVIMTGAKREVGRRGLKHTNYHSEVFGVVKWIYPIQTFTQENQRWMLTCFNFLKRNVMYVAHKLRYVNVYWCK